mmetsp:Transcript_28213/g.52695  ORF Transcript_28213/g.52695 Transcript_28213/m.52695 type:complete len:249 (+) Transcript_28213:519-1265(+)
MATASSLYASPHTLSRSSPNHTPHPSRQHYQQGAYPRHPPTPVSQPQPVPGHHHNASHVHWPVHATVQRRTQKPPSRFPQPTQQPLHMPAKIVVSQRYHQQQHPQHQHHQHQQPPPALQPPLAPSPLYAFFDGCVDATAGRSFQAPPSGVSSTSSSGVRAWTVAGPAGRGAGAMARLPALTPAGALASAPHFHAGIAVPVLGTARVLIPPPGQPHPPLSGTMIPWGGKVTLRSGLPRGRGGRRAPEKQ